MKATAAPDQRLADLARYRTALAAITAGSADATPNHHWPAVFAPLRVPLREHALAPIAAARAARRVRAGRAQPALPDRADLLAYCSRSANPIGRLLLQLYGIGDEAALRQSDALCSALQLINFWQDLSIDLPRGRSYLPAADLRAMAWSWPDRAATGRHPGGSHIGARPRATGRHR